MDQGIRRLAGTANADSNQLGDTTLCGLVVCNDMSCSSSNSADSKKVAFAEGYAGDFFESLKWQIL